MPLPAIIGGSIVKVGGSLVTATAINAILATLTKLKLPKGKIADILIDKILDYTINQVTATASNAVEQLVLEENIVSTSESIDIALPELSRALICRTTAYPDGIGRRFTDEVPGGLPDKFLFGAVSFGGSTSIVDSNGNEIILDVGLSNEQQIVWEKQVINIPRIGKDNNVGKAMLYVLPGMTIEVDVLKVKTD